MGYDSSRFLDEVDEEFHCSICSMVLEEPVQTPCDHSFCNDCIKKWLTLNAVCPVDRQSLKTNDLKPSSRIIRNFLAKLKINCEYRQRGCELVIPLEHLQNHLTSCEYNPTSEIICDRGCKLRMKRREYEAHNCLIYLSSRVAVEEKENIRLTQELTNQREGFRRTLYRREEDNQRALNHQNDEHVKLKDENVKLKDENVRLKDELRSLQEQIGRLMLTPKQIEIKKRPLKWQKVNGINISTELNILETTNFFGYAQLCYPLDSSNSSFKVEILSKKANDYIWIGLCTLQGSTNDNIRYRSDGKLNGGIFKDQDVPALAVGDIIEFGINYPNNFNIDGTDYVELYFNKNGELILKQLVEMPPDGFYPSVCLHPGHKIKVIIN